MKRTRSFRLVAAGVVVALTSAVAVQTTTQTASANDYQIIYDNLDDALGILLTGVADSVEDYLATMSYQSAAAVLNAALVAAGSQIVAGTAQFGALALGIALMAQAFQTSIDPFLAALDDPSTATAIFDGVDLEAIAAGIPALVSNLLVGGGFYPGILDGLALILQGEIFNALGQTFLSIVEALFELLAPGYVGTLAGPLQLVGVAGLVGLIGGQQFVGAYIVAVEDALAPTLNGTLGFVTGPLVSLLTGFTIPALPIPLP